MSLKNICREIAQHRGLTTDAVYDLAREVFDRIEDLAVTSGHCVIRPFGTFKLVRRSPRQARNPRTNQPLALPARVQLTFMHGKGRRSTLSAALPPQTESAE